MGILELLILAVGLSMDAFAVSVCKGLAMKKCSFKNAAVCGVWFGGFQALMPALGYLLGYPVPELYYGSRSLDRVYPAGSHRRQYDTGIFFEGRGR